MHLRELPARLLPAVAALAVLTTACSSSDSPTSAPPAGSTVPAPGPATSPATPSSPAGQAPPAAASAAVTIKDFAYEVPSPVKGGTEVTVTNEDNETHSVTLGGGAKARVVVQGGATVTFAAPTKAGTYPISCDFHGNMHGELVVS